MGRLMGLIELDWGAEWYARGMVTVWRRASICIGGHALEEYCMDDRERGRVIPVMNAKGFDIDSRCYTNRFQYETGQHDCPVTTIVTSRTFG